MRFARPLSATAAAALLAIGCGGDDGGETSSRDLISEPAPLKFVRPAAATVPSTVSIPTGGPPIDVVAGDEGAWVTVDRGARDSEVLRIDPATDRVVASVQLEGSPLHLAEGEGSVWVTGAHVLHRIDPRTNRIVTTTSFPGRSTGPLAAGHGAVWLVLSDDETGSASLARIDPKATEVERAIPLEAGPARHNFDELAVTEGAVWVLALDGLNGPGDVVRVDPESGRVAARVPAEALNTGAGPGGLWITGCVDCEGYRSTFFMQEIDTGANAPVGPRIAIRKMGSSPLFVDHHSVWFLGSGGDEGTVVIRLDPETHAIEELLRLGDYLHRGTAFDREHGAIWIARVAPASVVRVALTGRS